MTCDMGWGMVNPAVGVMQCYAWVCDTYDLRRKW